LSKANIKEVSREQKEGSAAEYITVSELNHRVRELIDGEFGFRDIWVLGEFSNLKHFASGHLYPTLKDGTSEIQCVIWAGTLGRLSVRPEEGMKVLVRGYLGVYEQKGRYQLYVADVKRFGVGELYAKLEALKAKLKQEGLFARKRPLPRFPAVVGIVTSDTGAAVRDMIRILSRRFPPARILLAPVLVQGAGAAKDIAQGIEALNRLRDPHPDVIIVGRGGGSIEDLWAFNEEILARAIFASEIPVVTGVGHETDFTISDFVADLRAATPSEAAEKVVPDKEAVLDEIGQSQAAIYTRTVELLQDYEQSLDEDATQFTETVMGMLSSRLNRVEQLAELLQSLDPHGVLKRGYAVVTRKGIIVGSVSLLHPRDNVDIMVVDGRAAAQILKVTERKVTPSGG